MTDSEERAVRVCIVRFRPRGESGRLSDLSETEQPIGHTIREDHDHGDCQGPEGGDDHNQKQEVRLIEWGGRGAGVPGGTGSSSRGAGWPSSTGTIGWSAPV